MAISRGKRGASRKGKRCQGVGGEERGRKKTKWLMLTQGKKKKKSGRSNKATSAMGSLFLPPPPPSRLISSKLCGLPSFFSPPFFIPPYESSPRLLLANPNYSGRHCLPPFGSADRQTDRQAHRQTGRQMDRREPICPLTDTRKRKKKKPKHNKKKMLFLTPHNDEL